VKGERWRTRKNEPRIDPPTQSLWRDKLRIDANTKANRRLTQMYADKFRLGHHSVH
jgi:hypothetical protein